MSDSLKISRNGQILEIVLDRPKANAIDAPLSREMGTVKSWPAFMKMLESSDAKEGVAAFVEKRKPDWKGR